MLTPQGLESRRRAGPMLGQTVRISTRPRPNNCIMSRSTLRPSPRCRGFTLIELMIVVAVVALLAAVAFPSFMDSIRKGRRSEAFAALANVQQAQERWRSNNATYNSDLSGAAPTGLGIAATTSSGYYSLSLADVTATGYVAVATAVAGSTQASDGTCAKLGVRMLTGNLRYDASSATGTLTFPDPPTNKCWGR